MNGDDTEHDHDADDEVEVCEIGADVAGRWEWGDGWLVRWAVMLDREGRVMMVSFCLREIVVIYEDVKDSVEVEKK